MAEHVQVGADVIVMNAVDHVATALRDLQAGETLSYTIEGRTNTITVMEAVPFGHKIAIVPIAEGDSVRKYGEVIGRATRAIEPGHHVHVHNIEGIRGRGDKARKEGEAPV
jgi:altronate dehydratase small subunit